MNKFDELKDLINQAKNQFRRTNILVTGKTGVGKSTLLNAIFGEDLAETGSGKPCTENIKEYAKEGFPIHLVDTRGLELANFNTIADDLVHEILNRRRSPNADDYIHIAWYCINYTSKRIEDAEFEFISKLSQEIPVIVILTQCIDTNLVFFNQVQDLCFTSADTICVLALPFQCPLGTVDSFGLRELIEKTMEKIPEAQKNAFVAAQIVDLSLKEREAKKFVAGAATAAATAGATPIPFSDAAVLAPIQIGMLASISFCMGLEMTTAFLSTLVSSTAGVVGATYAGRSIVSGLLKLIPGAGSIVGGAISAATAATLTTTMGLSYIKTLKYMIQNNLELTPDTISDLFIKILKKEDNLPQPPIE